MVGFSGVVGCSGLVQLVMEAEQGRGGEGGIIKLNFRVLNSCHVMLKKMIARICLPKLRNETENQGKGKSKIVRSMYN